MLFHLASFIVSSSSQTNLSLKIIYTAVFFFLGGGIVEEAVTPAVVSLYFVVPFNHGTTHATIEVYLCLAEIVSE